MLCRGGHHRRPAVPLPGLDGGEFSLTFTNFSFVFNLSGPPSEVNICLVCQKKKEEENRMKFKSRIYRTSSRCFRLKTDIPCLQSLWPKVVTEAALWNTTPSNGLIHGDFKKVTTCWTIERCNSWYLLLIIVENWRTSVHAAPNSIW